MRTDRRHVVWWRLCLLAVLLLPLPATATRRATIDVSEALVQLVFPEKMTFHAKITSSQPIKQIVLEYGVVARTCGKVMAKAFPDFTVGTTADVEWTWEMRQSGSEPPGARIWYRWRITDDAGQEHLSDEQTVLWLDDLHDWQSETAGMLTLHSYYEDPALAGEFLASASNALTDLRQTSGITPQEPIDLYVYATNEDMQDAILYEPGWTGGQAFATRNIVIIGIDTDQVTWGKRTLAHELTHVLVGHLAFTCLGDVPTWLNEGIAVYAEGEPEQSMLDQLDQAIDSDTLISVRALSGGFSEHPDRADLSYAESWSLVDFLIKEHGQDKLLALFGSLRDGRTNEDALQTTYGFGLDGLETAWRTSLNAQPRQDVAVDPTPTRLATPVPTYPLIRAAPEVRVDVVGSTTAVPATTATTLPAAGVAEPQPVRSGSVWVVIVIAVLALVGLSGLGIGYRIWRRR